MEKNRSLHARSLVCLLFMSLLLILLLAAGYYLSHPVAGLDDGYSGVQNFMNTHFVPLAAAAILCFSFFSWFLIRRIYRRPTPGHPPAENDQRRRPDQKQTVERGLFLYLLSHMQRNGRLLDFLAEDLNRYEDAQIGAAVRNIHQNCRQVIEKCLSPEAVLNQAEGEVVTIEAGFDPEAVRLTGNVTGDPPFKGILRHKGWQAGHLELPELVHVKDSAVIAPAEVEIS